MSKEFFAVIWARPQDADATKKDKRIAELEAELAALKAQESVAWLYLDSDGNPCDASLARQDWKPEFTYKPLYAHPVPTVPEGHGAAVGTGDD